jgi:hypothetical protein
MENLANAIVDSGQLLIQVIEHLANGNADAATNTAIPVGDTVSSIFSNLVSFLTQLASEIAAQI